MINNRYLYTITVIAAFSGFTSNYSSSAMTGALPFIQKYFELGNFLLGIVTSSLAVGAIAGAALTGTLPDKIGRKPTLRLAALIYLFSTLLVGFSITPYDLIFYRIMMGVAVGMTSIVAPMYLAEIAPSEKRGVMVTSYQMAIVIGIMMSYLIDYFLTGVPLNWRIMLGMAALPSAILLLILAFLPESPRWLILNRNEEKAMDTLRKIGGKNYAIDILKSVNTTVIQKTKPSFRDLFQRRYLKVLVIGAVLTIIQQWCGTNLIFSYSPLIFQAAGFDTSHAVLQTVLIGFCNFLATIISIRLVRTMNRKTILIIGLASIFITLILIGLYFQLHLTSSWILILSALLCVSAFAMTLGPVMWIVIAEISPSQIRSQAMSLFIFCLWTAGMLGTFSFPLLRSALGTPVIFYSYAVICMLSIFFISEFVPETKDKSLEEIEKLFE